MSAGPRGPNRRTKGWEWQPPHQSMPGPFLPQKAQARAQAMVELTKKTYEPRPGEGLPEDEPLGASTR